MLLKDLFFVIVPFLSVIIGGYVTYFFTVKQKKSEAMLRYKEERYSKLLSLLKGFTYASASGELKKEFFNETYKSWLYCSDEVTLAINKMIEYVRTNQNGDKNEGSKMIGDIVFAMRKDMVGKTKLKHSDFRFYHVVD